MSPDVDTTKPSTLPGSPFNLLSIEHVILMKKSRGHCLLDNFRGLRREGHPQ